jgi:hypothetical protein
LISISARAYTSTYSESISITSSSQMALGAFYHPNGFTNHPSIASVKHNGKSETL